MYDKTIHFSRVFRDAIRSAIPYVLTANASPLIPVLATGVTNRIRTTCSSASLCAYSNAYSARARGPMCALATKDTPPIQIFRHFALQSAAKVASMVYAWLRKPARATRVTDYARVRSTFAYRSVREHASTADAPHRTYARATKDFN